MQMEDVDVIGPEPAQRRLEIGHHRGPRQQLVAAPDPALGRKDDGVAGDGSHRCADDRLGTVGFRRIEEVNPRSIAWRTSAIISVSLLPADCPSRLAPPQPSPATLTLNPVRPRRVNSIAVLPDFNLA